MPSQQNQTGGETPVKKRNRRKKEDIRIAREAEIARMKPEKFVQVDGMDLYFFTRQEAVENKIPFPAHRTSFTAKTMAVKFKCEAWDRPVVTALTKEQVRGWKKFKAFDVEIDGVRYWFDNPAVRTHECATDFINLE